MENKTSLILHGHFYQPPRENPSTGIIDIEESAFPSINWNENIYSCCYKANAYSRYLDNSGRIEKIINNYEYLSFNFGPTLMHWIKEKHKDTYEKIIEGDKKSIKRLGYGNAIAQSFNHTILPLDSPDDVRLQLSWGIEDFINTYKRDAEGIWLPECGCNEKVVQILSEMGIKFIILSPFQCEAIENDDGEIISLMGKAAPYNEPYILTGSNGGEVAVFFYEGDLASSISFGHALHSADELYSTLLKIKNETNTPLLHTATDGEIYGHHEPFGDMALAALIEKVESRNDFIFDNYSHYLSLNPPTKRAILKKGEDGKGSSWSCSHGVSRWYKDCGCHTGGDEGWNQKWRGPLRNSFNTLKDKLDALFKETVSTLSNNELTSFDVLSSLGDVLANKTDITKYTKKIQSKYLFSESDRVKLSREILGMKYIRFSFTSCGWFFSDISGLEPRMCIRYALEAISLFQEYTTEELTMILLSTLKEAVSNIKEIGSGADIAQDEMSRLSGEEEAVLYFYLEKTIIKKDKKTYGFFTLKKYKDDKNNITLSIFNNASGEETSFMVFPSSNITSGLDIFISELRPYGEKNNRVRVTLTDIPKNMYYENEGALLKSMFTLLSKDRDSSISIIKSFSLLNNVKENANMTLLNECIFLSLSLLYHTTSSLDNFKNDYERSQCEMLISFIEKYGDDSTKAFLYFILNSLFTLLRDNIRSNGLNDENIVLIKEALTLFRTSGKEGELGILQDEIYLYKTGIKESKAKRENLEEIYALLNFSK